MLPLVWIESEGRVGGLKRKSETNLLGSIVLGDKVRVVVRPVPELDQELEPGQDGLPLGHLPLNRLSELAKVLSLREFGLEGLPDLLCLLGQRLLGLGLGRKNKSGIRGSKRTSR